MFSRIFCCAMKRSIILLFMMAMTTVSWGQINTEQVLNIGRNALYFEDYILSIQYFNQVIKSKPFLAEPYFYRGVAKINLEDYPGAETDASLAIERNPFIVDAYQVRGIARQNQGKFAEAIEDYNAGLRLNPEEKRFMLNRAVCQAQLRRYDEARCSYDTLLTMDPRNDRAYLGLAHMQLAQHDTVAALKSIDKSIELSKNNATAYVMRAEVQSRAKNFEAALADMDEAIKLEPHYAGYFVNRAFMKYNLDDYYGAMADFDYAIGLDPASIEAHFNRALLLSEVGDTGKAIDDFNYVLRSDPQNFMAIYNRANLYFRTAQYRKAVADYTTIIEKYPEFEAGYMARGEAKRKMGDMRGGNADYDRALAIFRRKKTHVSTFNPLEIEATAAIKKAEQRALTGEDEPESAEEIMNRFNTLLTVAPENPVKPEYANKTRGRIQNTSVDIEPEPMFVLAYASRDNKLNGMTYYMKEIADVNDTHMLPATLSLTSGSLPMSEDEIGQRFASIDYYNGLLSTSQPRAVDYFARGIDHLLVKNPVGAVADANRAIALSPDLTVAYFLRADAHYLQYRMERAQGAAEATTTEKPLPGETLLHRSEDAALLSMVVDDLNEVLARSPRNVYAHFNRGYAYLLMGDYTSAISSFTRAIELKPDLGEAYYNRGLLYLRLGNKQAGVPDMSKAGELGILPSYNVLKRMNN